MPNDFSSRAEAIRSRCEHLQRQAGNLQAWLDSNSLNDPPIIETITDDLGGGRDDTTVPETMIQCAADTLAMLAEIERLTAQVETLQATYDELCQRSIRTGDETALNVAADVELKRRGYHFLPEVGIWVLTLEAPMTPRLTDAERVELAGLLASITLPTLTAREREVAHVVALKMKQRAEAQVTALRALLRECLNNLDSNTGIYAPLCNRIVAALEQVEK